MKTSEKITYASLVGLSAIASMPNAAHAAIVINEVYGGGASTNTTTTFKQDYVELFNNGTAAVDISSFILAYASASTTGIFAPTSTSTSVTLPANVQLSPLSFYVIAGGTNTTAGASLPVSDATSGLQLAATAGKLELLDTTGSVVDFVGYGTTASTFEGLAAAPSPSITTSIGRTGGLDSNQNAVDFTVGTPTPGAVNAPVPEPTTLGLAASAALLLTRRRAKNA